MWAYDLWFKMNLRPCSDISVFAWKQRFFLSFQKKKINRRLHVAFLNRFCPSTRKRHSYWQQYHLIGACLYNGLSVRDVIFLKSRRRQRERQKKKKKVYIRKTTTLHVQHTFLYISLPSLHDCDVKFPQVTFRGGRKHRLDYKFLFLPLNLVAVPKNSIPGKFTYIRLRFYTSRKNRDQH